eukprot:s3808_g2.t1
MIRGACILLALRVAAAEQVIMPSCATKGVAYSTDRDTANALPNGAYVTDSVQCQTSLGWARCSWPAPRVFRFQALGQTFDVQIRCRGDVSNRFPTPDWPETSLSSA